MRGKQYKFKTGEEIQIKDFGGKTFEAYVKGLNGKWLARLIVGPVENLSGFVSVAEEVESEVIDEADLYDF